MLYLFAVVHFFITISRDTNTVESPVREHPKCPAKMSSGGGRLREVVAYESLDHNGSKFFLITIS